MNATIHLTQYTLVGESVPAAEETVVKEGPELQAVATWKSTVDELQLATTTWYWSNVGVTSPYQLLNDANNNPIWVIEAIYTFSDVAWRYAHNGEVITDYCGKHGQVDPSFTAPKANIFQLVPALREKGGANIRFNNNGCYNPARIRWDKGGRLMVIPNDRPGTYGDNSGSFDVKVAVVEFLP